MRRYGLPEPYEQLKALTRGERITRDALQQFVRGLALPDDAKERLLTLTPASYVGLARKLAEEI
jgi:adenylosuccinate lyase